MKNLFAKKIVSALLVVSIFGGATFAVYNPGQAPRAHALLGEGDSVHVFLNTDPGTLLFHTLVGGTQTAQTTIMQVLNGLAWSLAKAAIRTMTSSIVNWINSGFQGSPAFATDLGGMMRRIGDGVAAQFVGELINTTSINSPYLQRALNTVAQGYLLYTSRDRIVARLRSTLGEYSQNEEAFRRGQFNEGGFNAWFAVTLNCGDDPFCVEATAQEELVNRIDQQTRQRLEEIDWGRGFLSWRNCPDEPAPSDSDTTALSDADTSSNCTISTPGSVIESALIENVNSPLHELQLADSINEIVGALASQLVSQVLGGTGLLGATQPSSSGGRSYLEQVTNQGTNATLVAGFEQTARAERDRIAANKAAWEQFRPVAVQAVTACTAGTGDPAMVSDASSAVTRADTLISRAASSLATLDAIIANVPRVETLTGNARSALVQQLTNDYNGVLASGGVDAPTEALVTRINAIVESGCN